MSRVVYLINIACAAPAAQNEDPNGVFLQDSDRDGIPDVADECIYNRFDACIEEPAGDWDGDGIENRFDMCLDDRTNTCDHDNDGHDDKC